MTRNRFGFLLVFLLACCTPFNESYAQPIKNDLKNKSLTFGNNKIKLVLDYNQKCNISSLIVNGQKVIEGAAGIFSEIRTTAYKYSTLQLKVSPKVTVTNHVITINGITFGDDKVTINETWKFVVKDTSILFDITRTIPTSIAAEEASFPSFNFNNINTWEGAFHGFGGVAWFYLFNEKLSTYGVHTNQSSFWNSKTGNGLKITVAAPGKQVAMKYTRTNEDQLAYSIALSEKEMIPRYDSGTNRKRFIRKHTDVWAPFNLTSGTTTQSINLAYFNFNEQYNRGKFVGMDGAKITSVLNTIARMGVIDAKHFGGNSWHTPYGPICLHEQYIAQMGLAINDNTYLQGYKDCLDYYRDNAIKPNGRVWARWAYNNVDIMQGQVTDKGFYEAQWGFLMDSNPDFVTNVAELYNQCGDKEWVKKHQLACEKALDYILYRDANSNNLVEMMTDSHKEKRGSDWIDIIWAAYENAFVNAKLYYALVLWTDIEVQLGNEQKAKGYSDYAAKLKVSFNKSTKDGGFWDEEKKCYIHWRDKDNSIHGNNMVTPVNFMAIAYGICNDDTRRKTILDNIETQMQKEKLFFWPLNLYSYKEGEGNDWQFPFPNYENGDIFLSWGSVAVKAYADYKPDLALKYVENVLNQHSKDGLAFQRYGREKQNGLGDDILSGNSLAVVGLYQAIYGINPLYNRFYLNPHIIDKLAGTQIKYNYRDQKLTIGLEMNNYSVANDRYKIISKNDFGFYGFGRELLYFNGNKPQASFKVTTEANSNLTLDISKWEMDEKSWIQSSRDAQPKKLIYRVNDLKPNNNYTVLVNGKTYKQVRSKADGSLMFDYKTSKYLDKLRIVSK